MFFLVLCRKEHSTHLYPLHIASLAFEAAHFGRASRGFGFADWTRGKLKTVGGSVGFVTVGTRNRVVSTSCETILCCSFLLVAEVQFEGQLPSHGVRSYHGFVTMFASSFVCVLCSTAMILLGQL